MRVGFDDGDEAVRSGRDATEEEEPEEKMQRDDKRVVGYQGLWHAGELG